MKLLFMGRKETAARSLEWAIKSGFEVVACVTDSHLSVSPTKDIATKFGVPILSYKELMQRVTTNEISFDVGVSVVFWRVIKQPVIDSARYGIVNFHPAPLPEYKGTAGYNLGILGNRDSWAVTAHYVDEQIDTGAIIDAFEFSIDSSEETAQTLEAKSQEFMFSLFKKTMKRVLIEGKLTTTPNEGGYYTSRDDMENMKKLESTDDWDRKIRAFWFPPYTGAYIEHNGKKYTVINNQILRNLAPKGASTLFD